MAAFEDRFYRENPALFQRLRRNASLLLWLAGGLVQWLRGRRVRIAYERAQQSKAAIVLEDYVDPGVE
jgi:hypothetical protein